MHYEESSGRPSVVTAELKRRNERIIQEDGRFMIDGLQFLQFQEQCHTKSSLMNGITRYTFPKKTVKSQTNFVMATVQLYFATISCLGVLFLAFFKLIIVFVKMFALTGIKLKIHRTRKMIIQSSCRVVITIAFIELH